MDEVGWTCNMDREKKWMENSDLKISNKQIIWKSYIKMDQREKGCYEFKVKLKSSG
jgi:hypothetical protein